MSMMAPNWDEDLSAFRQSQAVTKQTEQEALEAVLEELRDQLRLEYGQYYARLDELYDAADFKDDDTLEQQIKKAKKLVAAIKALNKRESSPARTKLTPDQEKLAELLNNGTISLQEVEMPDPQDPAKTTKVMLVRDPRWGGRARVLRAQASTSSPSAAAAPVSGTAQGQPKPGPQRQPIPAQPVTPAPVAVSVSTTPPASAQSVPTPVTPPQSNPVQAQPIPVQGDPAQAGYPAPQDDPPAWTPVLPPDPVASSDSSAGVPAGDDGSDSGSDNHNQTDAAPKAGRLSRVLGGTKKFWDDLNTDDHPQTSPTTPSSNPAQPQPNTQ